MRDWAVGQAGAGCFSWAALSSNDSKTRYVTNMAGFFFHRMTFSDWAGHWLNLPLVIYRDMMRGDVQNNDEVKSKDPTAPVRGDQIRVENTLYSTEKLANLHPGGPLFIKV